MKEIYSYTLDSIIRDAKNDLKTSNALISAYQSSKYNNVLQRSIDLEINRKNNKYGFLLGIAKLISDVNPERVSTYFKKNNVNYPSFIKNEVDKNVLYLLQKNAPDGLWKKLISDDYTITYRKLMAFFYDSINKDYSASEKLAMLFPSGISEFVSGFAYGYSEAFIIIAMESDVEIEEYTAPLFDVLKNYLFFFNSSCLEYKLSGNYIFISNYDKQNVVYINGGIYNKLRV